MSKFKIGDRVILTNSVKGLAEGWIGHVVHIVDDKQVWANDANLINRVYTLDIEDLEILESKAEQYTGGSSNYYKVFIQHPTTLNQPYEAECNDIIEALNMTFAEGNAFKAIWRKAKARQGVQKKGYDNGLYDSEKVVFFGERMVIEAKNK